MPLREAMETQRAIRRLKRDPVDNAVIIRCIEMALKAPTGGNAQNWEWIVVRDPLVKANLARLYRQAWRLYGGLGRIRVRGNEKMQRVIRAVQWQVDHFEEVPVMVVPCLRGALPRFISFTPVGASSHLRLDLSGHPELPPGMQGRGPRGGAYHASDLVDHARQASAWPSMERPALRRNPSGVAQWAVRTDEPEAGRESRPLRPMGKSENRLRAAPLRAEEFSPDESIGCQAKPSPELTAQCFGRSIHQSVPGKRSHRLGDPIRRVPRLAAKHVDRS
jgi:nitroreductase